VKEICGSRAHLKVIIETGELGTYDNVRRASLLAIAGGADFIKTSTGKAATNATLPVALCMLEVIRDVHEETGRVVGMKVAGGIRQSKQAVQFLVQVYETLGLAWLTPDRYRIGASTLLNDVLMQIHKERTGRYQNPDYFTLTERKQGDVARRADKRRWRQPGTTRPRRSRATSCAFRSATGSSSAASSSSRCRASATRRSIQRARSRSPRSRRRARPMSIAPVKAARGAFDGTWSKLRPSERAKYLFRIARILQERAREFAVLESMNGGKPIRESRDVDVPLAPRTSSITPAGRTSSSTRSPTADRVRSASRRRSFRGTSRCSCSRGRSRPRSPAGNTVVLKPAETTPLSALLFCDVLRQAELPPGVVNIITGDGRTGAEMVAHPGVDKIAFTGSTEVGKAIQRTLAGTGKRLTLELGGKAANIIFDDAPLDQAVEGIINGIYFNQGHVCCAGSRLLVQESIYEATIAKLKRRMRTLRVGDPLDKNTDVGAINSKQQLDKIASLVQSGVDEGAEIYQPPCKLPERGYWFVPTVFTNVAQSYRIAQEEIFGPVLSVLTFRTPDEAIEKANNTPYGLSAGVWTEKGSRILAMAQKLRAGVVWANTYNRFDPASPFGGYKESGFGREGGRHGLEAYVALDDA
jgi:aldehyde dehydrogenase (NAD+)